MTLPCWARSPRPTATRSSSSTPGATPPAAGRAGAWPERRSSTGESDPGAGPRRAPVPRRPLPPGLRPMGRTHAQPGHRPQGQHRERHPAGPRAHPFSRCSADTLYLVETIGRTSPRSTSDCARAPARTGFTAHRAVPGPVRSRRARASLPRRTAAAVLGRDRGSTTRQRVGPEDPLLGMHLNLIARQARIRRLPAHQLPAMRPVLELAIAAVGSPGGGDARRGVPRADPRARGLTEPLTAEQLRRAAGYVLIAAQILTTATTGMRRSELMEITAGIPATRPRGSRGRTPVPAGQQADQAPALRRHPGRMGGHRAGRPSRGPGRAAHRRRRRAAAVRGSAHRHQLPQPAGRG